MDASNGITRSDECETWKSVPGWEHLYSVSDLGRVRSEARLVARSGGTMNVREKILKPRMSKSGYLSVALCRDNAREDWQIHRLVLFTFVGPCPDGMICCHWDDNPENNSLVNLRWGTPSDNTHDRVRNGSHHSARKTHCPRGHALRGKNVVAAEVARGRRGCRSCANARSRIVLYPEMSGDFQKVADSYYLKYSSNAA